MSGPERTTRNAKIRPFGESMMSKKFFVGVFTNEHDVLDATTACREAGFAFHDVFLPYAVHGMEDAMGIKRSWLTWVTFLAGAAGTTIALAGQWYVSAYDWPLNIGGKDPFALPAFIPIAFELTVLIGGLSTVAALFAVCKLFPGKDVKPIVDGVTDDKFAIVLERTGNFDEARARSGAFYNPSTSRNGFLSP